MEVNSVPENDGGRRGMDQSGDTLPCDDFPIRRTHKTPGEVISSTGRKLVLHNHEQPCAAAERLESFAVRKLGKEVPYRPGLKKFCENCEWPGCALAAFKREVHQFRSEVGR